MVHITVMITGRCKKTEVNSWHSELLSIIRVPSACSHPMQASLATATLEKVEKALDGRIGRLGSRALGELIDLLKNLLLKIEKPPIYFLFPERLILLRCLAKQQWSLAEKQLAAADLRQKLCERGMAMPDTEETRALIVAHSEAAYVLWNTIFTVEGHPIVALLDERWIIFPTSKLQLMIARIYSAREVDARTKLHSKAAISVCAPDDQVDQHRLNIKLEGTCMLPNGPSYKLSNRQHTFA